MQSFFTTTSVDHLHKRDFQVFYPYFKKLIEEEIPTFDDLFFFHSADEACRFANTPSTRKVIEDFFSSSNMSSLSYCYDGFFFLSVPTVDGATLAILSGIDPYFAKKVAGDWILKLGHRLQEFFLLVKRAGTDLATGLPNSHQFYDILKKMADSKNLSVMLIEVYPRARSAYDAKNHSAKVVHSLRSCLNGKIPVYYLGHEVFAVVSTTLQYEVFVKLGRSVLTWLKRDGFHRVHIGLQNRKNPTELGNESYAFDTPVDEAWRALHTARKRGPYALCDFDLLAHPQKHVLRRPTRSLLAKFRRKWHNSTTFAIVQFQPKNRDDIDLICQSLQDFSVITEAEDVYVFHDGKDSQWSLQWATAELANCSVDHVMVGVASFPYDTFTKSATVMNCRKALQHAAFFGTSGKAIFNSVSLNISGDIYYSEGDLTSAVREYRRGLSCDPTDINLLNSLGVAYADMTKHRVANDCFKNALELEPHNFMALYNLGLGEETCGRIESALAYFELAYQSSSERVEGIIGDLQFQLGKLYSKTASYDKAVEILEIWYKGNTDITRKDRAMQYLGRSFFGLKKTKKAMLCLQRALRFDEFDADSMGLLGLVYLLRQEGDEIALSLCNKSVDLNPDSRQLRLYLARAQMANSYYFEARENLKKCVRNRSTKAEAQLLFCKCYMKEESLSRARYWHNRFLQDNGSDSEWYVEALKLGEEIDGK